jgi:hypothetical protein
MTLSINGKNEVVLYRQWCLPFMAGLTLFDYNVCLPVIRYSVFHGHKSLGNSVFVSTGAMTSHDMPAL